MAIMWLSWSTLASACYRHLRQAAEQHVPVPVQDMLKFGNSSREYVFIHDKSAEEPA